MTNSQQTVPTFGAFFRMKRIQLGLTLRTFCEKHSFDPGNISKLERNILSPSISDEKLRKFAKSLDIKEGTADWTTFFDLANLAKGTVPLDIRNDKRLSSALPAFYRSMRGEKLTKEQIEQLLEILNQANGEDHESE